MLYARSDQYVLGYLGRALSLELTGVQQYSTQVRLLEAWGLAEAAERLRQETSQDMHNVERIISRMLALGVAPNASQLRPVTLGGSVYELLNANLGYETEMYTLYDTAVAHTMRSADHDNRLFFENLLQTKRNRIGFYTAWLKEFEPKSEPRESQSRVTF